jgi:Family of unknown function (DUF5681)
MDEQSGSKKPNTTGVGYGSPPERTRFKKGRSGNPQGRPKGTLNLATVLGRTLREKVAINENGRQKMVTKLEASVKQLVNKATAGDAAALRQLIALAGSAVEQGVDTSKNPLSDADLELMKDVLKRLEGCDKGGGDEKD